MQKGSFTCLLGESGSGKTTLTEILQKNYLPEKGELIINKNISLDDISLHSWRRLTGIVPQNIQVFNGNVLENIIIDRQADESKLRELTSLGFDKLIHTLPQGFSTLVGEEGINLSGGQKQLLGWMRALYHDPQFLILDEPTSSLDKENKVFIYGLIQKLKSEKIIFVISHNPEEVRELCDKVLLLENARISEE